LTVSDTSFFVSGNVVGFAFFVSVSCADAPKAKIKTIARIKPVFFDNFNALIFIFSVLSQAIKTPIAPILPDFLPLLIVGRLYSRGGKLYSNSEM
jgi:hypothetical protein